ncbi:glycosyltransferase family 4 protein [Sphingobacterium sp.]|uniref:MraY family glycosyltransferase n=1 Tax=Sphingobacterium sp. TaxID=341027 RepID=UPI0028AF58B4|nr:glycosyltransferase family 4 protein [Sphingobacterium sp.]
MFYTLVVFSLFLIEIIYFKIAERFDIIDKPNERSSHALVTLRGGGVIFYFGVLIYFFVSGFQYPWFFLGLSMMTLISFLDDIYTLSNKIRLLVHFVSVLLMAFQLEVFSMPWYYLIVTFIIIVGVINAYNFMDGINGITASYSLSVGILLIWTNTKYHFIDQDLLVCSMLGVLVFAFFNFREKAKCFAGDVGSVSIAFIILFALGLLIIESGNLIYILFLIVYGVDTIWTIIGRLIKRENIFKAHRSHLYQYLGNEAKINKLLISFLYGLIQFVIGGLVIFYANKDLNSQLIFSVVLILSMSTFYLVLKNYVIRKYA